MSRCAQRAEPPVDECGHPDDGHRRLRRRGKVEKDMCAGYEVDAGGDHGGGVDEGAHRGGPGHGVGKPRLQRQLGRFPDSSTEDEKGRGHRYPRPGSPVLLRQPHGLLDVQGAQTPEDEEQPHSSEVSPTGSQ